MRWRLNFWNGVFGSAGVSWSIWLVVTDNRQMAVGVFFGIFLSLMFVLMGVEEEKKS